MIFNLICTRCNNEQMVSIEELENDHLYKCKYCDNVITPNDAYRLSSLLDLQTFKLPNTYNFANKCDVFSLEHILEKIKNNYYDRPDEIKDKIFHLVDLLDRITEYKEIEPTLQLCEAVEKCYKEIVRKDHEEMSKLLGIDNDESLSEFYNL
ncbi:MAG: hypothetical protein IKJ87_02980 [Ruminococcus sp.]|nr:hypothetical protein [Ruminococcus sp.]